ncbi:unnamed protein product [Periconia digitata]|uniref:Amine oxidase domain-containing protein n=1 Tax=Periconia digitata TaxID=1303443 RepID=A0A9W4U6E2_9PLEO|nr:unnamed protein product [Periconia digitata]
MERKRIAIVGSGISGLSALWSLRDSDHEVHLYEKDARLGGHTNTATWTYNGKSTPVDTGFIVMNTATYPNFIAFLKAINVKTMASSMTFGISRDAGAFEWSGTSLGALFAQPFNALRPSFWRMIFDIVRFNLFSLDLLSSPVKPSSDLTIGQYLEKEGYSDAFRDDYLIPMTACVWSTGPDKCALEFPALTLVRFMWNHHLLSTVAERPPWLTIEGGSQRYIDALMAQCNNAVVHMSTPVKALKRRNGKVELSFDSTEGAAKTKIFDEVVLACHGDQARTILGTEATHDEKEVLSAFETSPNKAYLHSDLSLMPIRKEAWSSWNYITTSQPPSAPTPDPTSGTLQNVCLTYNMNILQSLPTSAFGDILVTLNPPSPPSPALTQASYEYRHPLYNARMVAAQEDLETIQGKRGIWYAGAWTGYGFHEDGFSSGMRVGLRLGGSVPWEAQDAKFIRGTAPTLAWADWVARTVVGVLQVFVGGFEEVVGVGRRRRSANAKVWENGNGHGVANGKAKAA